MVITRLPGVVVPHDVRRACRRLRPAKDDGRGVSRPYALERDRPVVLRFILARRDLHGVVAARPDLLPQPGLFGLALAASPSPSRSRSHGSDRSRSHGSDRSLSRSRSPSRARSHGSDRSRSRSPSRARSHGSDRSRSHGRARSHGSDRSLSLNPSQKLSRSQSPSRNSSRARSRGRRNPPRRLTEHVALVDHAGRVGGSHYRDQMRRRRSVVHLYLAVVDLHHQIVHLKRGADRGPEPRLGIRHQFVQDLLDSREAYVSDHIGGLCRPRAPPA